MRCCSVTDLIWIPSVSSVMGKPRRWLKHFLSGKKHKGADKHQQLLVAAAAVADDKADDYDGRDPGISPLAVVHNPATPVVFPPTTPREKRRWSFRRSSATPPASHSLASDPDDDHWRNHAMAVVAATAAAADAAAAAAQAAAAVMMLTAATDGRSSASIEEAAAIRIQSAFRSYLARTALRALRGLVKLQALVRGHLVRKQAKATLRCIQALVTIQARARAQRLRMGNEDVKLAAVHPRPSTDRKSTQDGRFRNLYQETDRGMREENIKIVEMDLGEPKQGMKSRNSYSYPKNLQPERIDHRFSAHCPAHRAYSSHDNYQQVSPALTEMSPRTCSGHFEDYAFCTTQSSRQCCSATSKPDPAQIPFAFPMPEYRESLSYEYPNYMANTESSLAKARSQSAPKQRPPDYFERPVSRRRPSMEGRGIPRGSARMQRSSSHVGTTIQGYQYPPWSTKQQLDRSTVSVVGSECGSTTSTVLTNTNYCKSLVSFDVRG
ncbi:hypothetical protein MLD38_020473 [Melastoma candidum]|uniref:Uncharacterized protein n=1 Tax=Melastoma candidum TaxID=119954 RepID=A0ACB9QG25_9MYRT|nr:hypothetical protein MLD38_020473 [Melastoma candidum]